MYIYLPCTSDYESDTSMKNIFKKLIMYFVFYRLVLMSRTFMIYVPLQKKVIYFIILRY